MLDLTIWNSAVVLVDWQERLVGAMPPAVHENNAAKAAILLRAARAAEVPVLATEQYPKGLGHTIPALREAYGEPFAPTEKRDFACTDVPEFLEQLTASGRTHVVLIGMEAHVCVYQTARGLLEEGFVVHVPTDAVVSRSKRDYLAAVGLYQQMGAVTTSVETVVFDWVKRAEGDLFKTVSRLVR